MARTGEGAPGPVLLLAVAATVVTAFPTFLLSALFVLIAADLDAPVWTLGAMTTCFWVANALAAPAAAAVARAIGVLGLSAVAIGAAATSLLGSGLFAATWQWMAVWAAVGGVGNALGHPASNQLLIQTMPERRMAAAYGLKQGAAPLASVIAGLAVPGIALTIGWRWAFLCGAVLAMLLVMAVPRLGSSSRLRTDHNAVRPRRFPPGRSVSLFTIAAVNLLAAGAATATVAYAVTGAVHRGLSPATSGVLLTAASLIGGVCRVLVGALADRGIGGTLPAIAAIQLVSAAGTLLMAWPAQWTFIAGLAAAVGVGWSWPGLMHYVVARMAPDAAVSATGTLSLGMAVGNAAVPLIIGVTYNPEHDTGTWLILTALMVAAAVLCWRSAARPTRARRSR